MADRALIPGPATITLSVGWFDGESFTPAQTIGPTGIPVADLKGSPFYERFMEQMPDLAEVLTEREARGAAEADIAALNETPVSESEVTT